MIDFSKFNSLFSVMEHFTTDSVCKKAIAQSRWADGDVVCPYCGGHHCHLCKECNHKFNVTVGTIFENTKTSLRKWFIAMYLISSHKKGVSSHQIARDCEVTQKTAWYMLQKIRTLFAQDDSVALDGEIEADEMYLGDREINKRESKRTARTQGRNTKTKTSIFGMVERENGKAVVIKVEDTRAKTLMPIIKQFVKDNAHIFTDELTSYSNLSKEGYIHDVIQHGLRMYINGKGVTTNSIEGFWGHFKRMVFRIYHLVSSIYLQRYIDEAVYRWNTRKASESERFADMFHKSVGVVSYMDVRNVIVN